MAIDQTDAPLGAKRLVTVVDGSPDAQVWVDALVAAAQQEVGNWPHPHLNIPRQQISLAKLWNAVERSFTLDGRPWSIVMYGFPRLPNLPHTGGKPADPDNDGSMLHNATHLAFGDFH